MDASGVLPYFQGVTVHDCWKSYWSYPASTHAICCAHLLHELVGVLENNPEQVWADKMKKPPNKLGRQAKGKLRSLVERLAEYKAGICLFAKNFLVPFDNNQAERDIRMVKVKTKVSGCFRTKEGADSFATIMSYVGTANKQGINSFLAIKNVLLVSPILFL